MRDSKNMVIGMLCAVVCIMAVAYAAFSTSLTVTTTATVASNWCVKIREASCPEEDFETDGAAGSVTASVIPAANGLSATFEMEFTQPGDSATCKVTYENCGSLNAELTHLAYLITTGEGGQEVANSLTINGSGTATHQTAPNGILFTISGLEQNKKLNAKTESTAAGTNTIVITGTFIDVEGGQEDTDAANKTATIRVVSSANQSV